MTRKKAIDLLLSEPYWEGTWDNTAAAHICGWVAEVEEEERGKMGHIPEYKRIFVTAANTDLHNRRLKIAGTQRGLEGLVFKQKVIHW